MLNEALVEGMRIVGIDFRDGILFVPEVLLAANAMKAGMEVLRPLLAETGAERMGTVVIGTVKGDIHDIGKNLVAMMLEGAGFEVFDLGINNPAENYIAAIEEHQPDIVGMSALLTTTMPYMKVVIEELEAKGLRDKVIVLVGGAPLNEEFGKAVGRGRLLPRRGGGGRDRAGAGARHGGPRRRWAEVAELTVIRWRDIPMQIVARGGRGRRGAPSAARAVPGGGRRGGDGGRARSARTTTPSRWSWTAARAATTSRPRSQAEVDRLEAEWTEDVMKVAIRAGGVQGGADVAGQADAVRPDRGTDVVDTVVSSATREVVIGSGRPFVVIGERINPTGRGEARGGDGGRRLLDGRSPTPHAQVAAGAHMLDVNAGIPLADEPAILAETIRLVQTLTDVPLSIDSSIVAALEAGLAVVRGQGRS